MPVNAETGISVFLGVQIQGSPLPRRDFLPAACSPAISRTTITRVVVVFFK